MKKKLFSFILAVEATIGIANANVDGIKIDDLYYWLNEEEKTASVVYQNEYSGNYQGLLEANIPSSVTIKEDRDGDGKNEAYTYRVVGIGYRAFCNCESLRSVVIPNTISTIETGAFAGCKTLTSIDIPNTVTSIKSGAFMHTGLKSIEIPNSITKIDNSTFYECHSLKNVIIPNSVTEIGEYAFVLCDSLSTINIPNSVTSIGKHAFYKCNTLTSLILSNKLTIIPEKAFYNCSALTSINIPNSVTSIRSNAFEGCTSLSSVIIGDSVISIGMYAFSGCNALTNIVIGNKVELIEDNAFSRCSGLVNIKLPQSVIKIGGFAFSDCSGITDIIIPDRVTTIERNAFSGCKTLASVSFGKGISSIGDKAFLNCSALKSVYISDIGGWCGVKFISYAGHPMENSNRTLYLNEEPITNIIIPDTVKAIKGYTFYNCKTLKTITIPSSVTKIGTDAFYGCSIDKVNISDLSVWCAIDFPTAAANPKGKEFYVNGELLTNLVVPDSVSHIGSNAFCRNKNITSVSIPKSVKSIGEGAFSGNSALESINIPNCITNIPQKTFNGCSKLQNIIIPDSVTSIGQEAFSHCSALSSIIMGRKVASIAEGAFSECSKLTAVYIKDLVAWCNISFISRDSNPLRYAKHLFLNDSEITNLVIPNGITAVKNYTFYGCSGLTSVEIPNSVTKIGTSSFENCSSVARILCRAATPPTCGNNAFSKVRTSIPLYVPEESISMYQSHSTWSLFENIYAIGSSIFCNVTFVDWNGIVLKSEQVEEGLSATAPDDPTREGYTFTGWDKDFSNVTTNMTVTAQYKINRYEVSFLDWDETELKKDSVNHGFAATAPADPTREGYTFTGWDKDFSNVTTNMTVTALYEKDPEPIDPEDIITRDILDLSVDGVSIDDWTINDATLNEKESDVSKKKYAFDVKAGIPSIDYVTSKPRFQFQYGNSADKAKAFFIYPGRCYESGGKNGLILISNTQKDDTIKLEVAAKGSTAGSFEDPKDAYPVNATALTEDLTLPAKGSPGADNNGYTWRTLEYLSQGGDVILKEVNGGYRIRLIELIHVESSIQTDITSAEGYQDTSVRKILRDGQIFILRGDKVYTITGQAVK